MLKKTAAVRKQIFYRQGISVAEWAARRGFNRALVYAVLNGHRRALRGQTHDIAVALGLKDGVSREASKRRAIA